MSVYDGMWFTGVRQIRSPHGMGLPPSEAAPSRWMDRKGWRPIHNHVYVAVTRCGVVKVGYAEVPYFRVKALRYRGQAGARLYAQYIAGTPEVAKAIEGRALAGLCSHRAFGKEWFSCAPDHAARMLLTARHDVW